MQLVAKLGLVSTADAIAATMHDNSLKWELVRSVNRSGWTPLHAAAKEPLNEEMVDWLIKRGADVNAATYSDWTPGAKYTYKENCPYTYILCNATSPQLTPQPEPASTRRCDYCTLTEPTGTKRSLHRN